MRRRSALAGMTLVELLVGLAIAAIVILPLADMLRTGSDSARTVRAGLDQNADARFAINRIAARAAAVSGALPVAGTVTTPAAWFAPLQYQVAGGNLVETDTSVTPARTGIIAANVREICWSAPDVGAGRPTVRVELVFNDSDPGCVAGAAGDCSVRVARTLRLGATP